MRPDITTELILGCQVAQSLKTLGDRWSFLILRDAFLGNHQFEQFRSRIGIARGTLTKRLNSLIQAGVLHKVPYQTQPVRHEYHLTQKGLGLYPMALTAWRWEHDWVQQQEDYSPLKLKHKACGNEMLPEVRCRHCDEIVQAHDVRFDPGPGLLSATPLPPRSQRRSRTKRSYPDEVDTQLFHLADVVHDRWTGLVVAALLFGLRRYDEIGAVIGIATNILADRLKLLTRAGIISRHPYQDKPVRHEYKLTKKGQDLYGHVLMMHQWADKWLAEGRAAPLLLTHINCGKPVQGKVVCSDCTKELHPGSVIFEFGQDDQAATLYPGKAVSNE